MSSKIQCPICGREVLAKALKGWQFHGYEVRRYECGGCTSKFNVYQGPKGMYTIPKRK